MCGIFGRLGAGPQVGAEAVKQAHEFLEHRGPDDQGWEQGADFELGFNRLAILDLSATGHQPMWDASQRYCLVFNGEIFNFRELKARYLPHLDLRGSSDTEVLLHLLIHKGKEATNLLNGMFAFCWLDTASGEYIMARDRFGIKPLYYTHWQGNLYFASELKALQAICPRPYQISEEAWFDYLGSGYVAGQQSIYQEVYRFSPAHFGYGNAQNAEHLNLKRYWQLEITEDYPGSYQKALAELDELLQDAVRLRLRSDVPLGVFLSGGIDSGLVAAMAAQQQEVDCYTISLPGSAQDESDLAQATARHIGARWHSIELSDLQSIDLEKLAWYYDEPFADSSAVPSFTICKAASAHATVFLTGDAGDEAFAGYKRYIKRLKYDSTLRKLSPLSHLPGLNRLTPARHQSKLDRLQAPQLFNDAYYDNLPSSWFYQAIMPKNTFQCFLKHHRAKAVNFYRYGDITSNQQYFDYQYYLPDDILVKMDRASMASSIEVRSPFLDYRLHELAARLPRKWLIDKQGGKRILRELAYKYLPLQVTRAQKAGFGIPVHAWTRQREFVETTYNRLADSPVEGLALKLPRLRELMLDHQSERVNLGPQMWKFYMYGAWQQQQNQKIPAES